MKSKLLISLVLCVFIFSTLGVLSLTGCKEEVAETTTAETTAAVITEAETTVEETTSEPVTLVWWDWQSSPNWVDVINAFVDNYKKDHPNFSLERTGFSYADYNTKLKTSLAAKEGPDCFQILPGAPAVAIVDAGQALDITDTIKNDAEWSEWVKPTFAIQDWYINDRIYYVPIDVNHLAVIYWKDMFESRNLKVPTTIDELYGVSEVFNSEEIIPLSTGFSDIWGMVDMFVVLVRAADTSGDLIDRAGLGQASWEDPLFKKALQTMVDLKNNGAIPSNALELSSWSDALQNIFNEKKAAAFWPFGQFGFSALPQEALENDEIGVIPLPRINASDKTLYCGGTSVDMIISPDSKNIEVVKDFLKFCNGPIGQEIVFDSLRTPPGTLVTKASTYPLFDAMTKNQTTTEIAYLPIDNPDIYAAVSEGIQKALIGENIDDILKNIESVSQEANK